VIIVIIEVIQFILMIELIAFLKVGWDQLVR
jgi:hypothetical protein